MIFKSPGIVLSSVKYSDTSLIVKVYTRLFGLQTYMVKGVRTSGKNNKASFFQPLTILDLEAYHRESKQMQFLKEFKPGYIYHTIHLDVVKSSIVIFLAEVLGKTIREEEPNHNLYDFIASSLIELDKFPKAGGNFHLYFLITLAGHLGFAFHRRMNREKYFDLMEGFFTDEIPVHHLFVADSCAALLNSLICREENLRMTVAERNLVLDKVLLYYQLHLQGFGKVTSHHVLRQVFEAAPERL